MKQYVVFLLASLFLLALQPLYADAGRSARLGFTSSRSFVIRTGPSRFVAPSVAITNPGAARFVRVSPFAREVIILPRHRFVGNTVIVREPFFCFAHGIGFINEALFFDHLHRVHGLAFETIPRVTVHNGPHVFFFGD